jgi:hypothetical protein
MSENDITAEVIAIFNLIWYAFDDSRWVGHVPLNNRPPFNALGWGFLKRGFVGRVSPGLKIRIFSARKSWATFLMFKTSGDLGTELLFIKRRGG